MKRTTTVGGHLEYIYIYINDIAEECDKEGFICTTRSLANFYYLKCNNCNILTCKSHANFERMHSFTGYHQWFVHEYALCLDIYISEHKNWLYCPNRMSWWLCVEGTLPGMLHTSCAGFLLLAWIKYISIMDNNHMLSKEWDEITVASLNLRLNRQFNSTIYYAGGY